jgi:hypothetical protein
LLLGFAKSTALVFTADLVEQATAEQDAKAFARAEQAKIDFKGSPA